MKPVKRKQVVDTRTTTVPLSSTYEEIGRLILVIVFSLLALGLLIGFFITRDPALLVADTLPGAGLAIIVPHYFNKK
jgi:hypothetical protein